MIENVAPSSIKLHSSHSSGNTMKLALESGTVRLPNRSFSLCFEEG